MQNLGITPTQVWAAGETPDFAVGTVAMAYDGKVYQLVQADASGVTGAGYVCVIEASSTVDMIDTTNSAPGAGAGRPVGVAMATIAASGYGWVCVKGTAVPTRVNAAAAVGTLLNTTATAGQLDDDATAGAERIFGLSLEVVGGGSAGNSAATLTFPSVGLTI